MNLKFKNMKSVILSTLLLGTLTLSAQSDVEKFESRKEKMKEHLTKALNLTPEQVKKVDAIDEKYEGEEIKLIEQRKQVHERLKELRDKRKEELNTILTPEQKVKFEKLQAERKKKMQGKFKKMRGDLPPPPAE